MKCDVTVWEDQVQLFDEAAKLSSSGKVDFVVANAGIIHSDDVFTFDGKPTTTQRFGSDSSSPGAKDGPKKPSLDIVDVNLHGALYTAKLAMHYFVEQNGTDIHPAQTDTCLVLIGSGAAYLDCPRGPQYSHQICDARYNAFAETDGVLLR